MMLLISFALTLLLRSASGPLAIAIYAVGLALLVWLWGRLKLHQYFFGD